MYEVSVRSDLIQIRTVQNRFSRSLFLKPSSPRMLYKAVTMLYDSRQD
jgi:hypothetical protein